MKRGSIQSRCSVERAPVAWPGGIKSFFFAHLLNYSRVQMRAWRLLGWACQGWLSSDSGSRPQPQGAAAGRGVCARSGSACPQTVTLSAGSLAGRPPSSGLWAETGPVGMASRPVQSILPPRDLAADLTAPEILSNGSAWLAPCLTNPACCRAKFPKLPWEKRLLLLPSLNRPF